METRKIDQDEIDYLLKLNEDHFNDFKSKRIKPRKLQESFVAFANSDGGELYVGIEDNSIETERYLLHFGIPKSTKVHYTTSGDCYLRINAASKKIKGDRITQLGYSKGVVSFEKQPVENAEVKEFVGSLRLLQYMQRVGSRLAPALFLKKQRLLSKRDDQVYPNVGCTLLFDDEPQATLDTRCAVKVYRLRTTENDYKREQLKEMPVTINGPVEDAIRETIQQVQKYIDGASFIDNGKTVKLLYPAEALKEVLVNALIHRDYSLNDDIHVRIFDNRIEIQSPGKLPGYMTVDNLYEDRFSRNPNVVRMLHNLPDPVNHDIGEGLDTAKNELKKAGLVDPIFQEKNNSFLVVIKHQRLASVEDVIVKYFEDNPKGSVMNKLIRQLSGEDDMQKVKGALQRLRANRTIKLEDENANSFHYRYIKG